MLKVVIGALGVAVTGATAAPPAATPAVAVMPLPAVAGTTFGGAQPQDAAPGRRAPSLHRYDAWHSWSNS